VSYTPSQHPTVSLSIPASPCPCTCHSGVPRRGTSLAFAAWCEEALDVAHLGTAVAAQGHICLYLPSAPVKSACCRGAVVCVLLPGNVQFFLRPLQVTIATVEYNNGTPPACCKMTTVAGDICRAAYCTYMNQLRGMGGVGEKGGWGGRGDVCTLASK